ncbi:MAG: MtrB/PioB family decaheme-associated outer membrane protein [Deltaproteobacteria bacterium]|nr:MtrB/PioB family decaheme-associated outer membrane protein [Deltaproteobacteria bacterium]
MSRRARHVSRPRHALPLSAIALLALSAGDASAQIVLRAEGGEASGTLLDPTGRLPFQIPDPLGLSSHRSTRPRSPSGLLYTFPWRAPRERVWGEDWLVRASASLGYLGSSGSDGEARFDKYVDLSDGFIAPDLAAGLRRRDEALYVDFRAQNAGRDDALYVGGLGRLGRFRVDGFHDALAHPSMHDARTPFLGVGTSSLRLPTGFALGGPARADLAVPRSTLAIERGRSGIDLIATPTPAWRISAAWRRDRREGTRPTGGSMFFAFISPALGSVVEAPLPVDQITNDVSAAIAYAGSRLQADLGYDYSRFENAEERLVWENPFPSPAVAQGQMALAPDNHAHALRGHVALQGPWRGRFTASAAWQRMEQDGALLPATINPALAPWDNVSALSRTSAEASTELLVARGELQLRPWRPLGLRVALRYEDRDQQTVYASRLGAVPGYVPEDGGAPATPQLRLGPAAFDREQLLFLAALDLRAARGLRLGAEYRRDARRWQGRERNRTADDTLRLDATLRRIEWLTLRTSYTYSRRRGSPYEPDPNAALIERAGGTAAVSAPLLRRPDLADRDRHDAELRLVLALAAAIDLSLTGRYRDDDYAADLGLTGEHGGDVSVELSHQPSPRWQSRLFASVDRRDRTIAGVAAQGTLFPVDNRWSLDSEATHVEVGLGTEVGLGSDWRLALDYTWLHGSEEIGYAYASTGALSPFGGPNPLAAGTEFPDLRQNEHVFETRLRWEPHEQIAACCP